MGSGFPIGGRDSIGISLIVLSVMLYGAILLLPLLPFSGKERLAAVPVLVILGEVAFWGSGALIGGRGCGPLQALVESTLLVQSNRGKSD